MYKNTLYITSPTEGKLYFIDNDTITKTISIENEARGVLVSQDKQSVYLLNKSSNLVSKFSTQDGSHLVDIKVGNSPTGICEDANGVLYVSNYGSNTISKIENGKVTDTINTGNGPYGVVVDENNNLYVACSSENAVYKYTNDIKVATISVGLSPHGIICDPYQNIWTANYGSNTVSKITKDIKLLDVAVGKGPIALVSDSEGSIFVANYLEDTVTCIPEGGSKDNVIITVGDGPTAIGVDQYDNIFVTSGLGTDVKKIVDRAVNGSIEIGNNPAGFGDFTGCATFNIFNTKPNIGVPEGGWRKEDLAQDVQVTLDKIDDAEQPTAETVSYTPDPEIDFGPEPPVITTVQEALDYILKGYGENMAEIYLTKEEAQSIYLSKTDAESTYAAKTELTPVATAAVKEKAFTLEYTAKPTQNALSIPFMMPEKGTITEVAMTVDSSATITQALSVELQKSAATGKEYAQVVDSTVSLSVEDAATKDFVEITGKSFAVDKNDRIALKCTSIKTDDQVTGVYVRVKYTVVAEED